MKLFAKSPITDLPLITFDSISALGYLLEKFEADNEIGDRLDGCTQSSHDPAKRLWDHGHTLADTIDTCKRGGHWAKGAKDLQRAVVEAPVSHDNIPQINLELGVVGARVDIGEYLNNSPECMLTPNVQYTPAKIVQVAVQLSFSASTSTTQAINRGRAILAVVESLEHQGFAVEVLGIVTMANDRTGFEAQIKLKDVTQTWTPATLAYALAHPAFLRRGMFRLTEGIDGQTITVNGYGSPHYYHKAYTEYFPIYFGYCQNDPNFNNPARALEYAEFVMTTFTANVNNSVQTV